MKNIIKTLVVIMCMGSLNSCYYDNPPEMEPYDCATVSYETDIQPLWDASCLGGCHSDVGSIPPVLMDDVSWTNLTGLNYVDTDDPEESSLYKAVAHISNPMPPGQPMIPQLDLDKILCWISEGAANN